MEEDLIIGVWDTFKDYVPEKNRETAATHFVDFLIVFLLDIQQQQRVH